jgi:hypothetical protein
MRYIRVSPDSLNNTRDAGCSQDFSLSVCREYLIGPMTVQARYERSSRFGKLLHCVSNDVHRIWSWCDTKYIVKIVKWLVTIISQKAYGCRDITIFHSIPASGGHLWFSTHPDVRRIVFTLSSQCCWNCGQFVRSFVISHSLREIHSHTVWQLPFYVLGYNLEQSATWKLMYQGKYA